MKKITSESTVSSYEDRLAEAERKLERVHTLERLFELRSASCPESVGTFYGEVSQSAMETVLEHSQPDDVFLDVGCGTGRWLLASVFRSRCSHAFGVEWVPERAMIASDVTSGLHVKVFCGDVLHHIHQLQTVTMAVFYDQACGQASSVVVPALVRSLPRLRCIVTWRGDPGPLWTVVESIPCTTDAGEVYKCKVWRRVAAP